jgi:hypothetical protein
VGLRRVPCFPVIFSFFFDMFEHNETYWDYSGCRTEHSDPNTLGLFGVGDHTFCEKVGGD